MGNQNAPAWNLFSLKPTTGGFQLFVFDLPFGQVDAYDRLHPIWKRLVEMTKQYDGDASALAYAWSNAALAQDNLTHVQNRCTSLLEELRTERAKLSAIRDKLYSTKFDVDQGASPGTLNSELAEILDIAR